MTTAIPCTDCTSITGYPMGTGYGAESLRIENFLTEVASGGTSQILGTRRRLIEELDQIYKDYSQPGWDGYDASSISEKAYIEAKKLISILPELPYLSTPEIVPEPTGEIGLEWRTGRRQVFILSVSGNNELIYAGLFGFSKTHGVELFSGFLPPIILSNLKRLRS